jgi:aminoglycoside phosphotransferase (APT) family kinase protein
MSTVGDPLLDLAWVMNGWTDPGEDRTSGYVDCTGMPSRDEMLHHYATVSGRNVDEIDYYIILARFKLAIVLEGGYARVVSGEADNPSTAAFGPVVLDTMAAAAELTSTTPLGR